MENSTVTLVLSVELAELISRICFAVLFHGASIFVTVMLSTLSNR